MSAFVFDKELFMDAIEALKTRRSIRAYSTQSVSREIIEDLIDCARLAPTAINIQPWEFVAVTSREAIQRLGAIAVYGKFLADATACIVVLCKDGTWYLEDGSAATQNILLAAHAHGLGSCWIAGDKAEYAEAFCKEIGVPEGYKLVSIVSLGYPNENKPVEKRELKDVLHWEKF
jgi:nitroreductase